MEDELYKRHAESVQAWLRDRRNVENPDTNEQDVIKELHEWLQKDAIEVERGNEKYFALLGKLYPIGFNRIDWSRVKPHRHFLYREENREVAWDELRRILEGFRESLRSWFDELDVSENEQLIFVDDSSDIALKMRLREFWECYPILLVQAGHVYVFPVDARWCLNSTLEGDLFLGRSTDVVGR